MDTIQQTTKVSVFALSELKGGLYIVEPSGDSDCIYNRFPGLAEIGYICVNKHGTTELKIVALDSYEINVDDDIALSHNEHLPRIIPAGSYEIRQCRSWEANPKGIWSLRID